MIRKVYQWLTTKKSINNDNYVSDYQKDIIKALRETDDDSIRIVGNDGMSRSVKRIRKSKEFNRLFKFTVR